MNAEELFVHDRGKGQCAEALHARVVDALGVLVLALELEGEVVGQVATLVVAAEEVQRLGIPYFERPEVQDALRRRSADSSRRKRSSPRC